MSSSFDWNAAPIKRGVEVAIIRGMTHVMSDCVRFAKRRVPVRTGILQGSLQMRAPVKRGGEIVGEWGSFNVRYALFVEMGTFKMRERPYLRPAADANYPKLPRYIAAEQRA